MAPSQSRAAAPLHAAFSASPLASPLALPHTTASLSADRWKESAPKPSSAFVPSEPGSTQRPDPCLGVSSYLRSGATVSRRAASSRFDETQIQRSSRRRARRLQHDYSPQKRPLVRAATGRRAAVGPGHRLVCSRCSLVFRSGEKSQKLLPLGQKWHRP